MTPRERFFWLWIVFMLEAIAIAIWAWQDAPFFDVALLFACGSGGPLALLIASLCCRKPLAMTIGIGTVLILGATVLTLVIYDAPLALPGMVLVIAVALRFALPNAGWADRSVCASCGYSLVGLAEPGCPECGALRAGANSRDVTPPSPSPKS